MRKDSRNAAGDHQYAVQSIGCRLNSTRCVPHHVLVYPAKHYEKHARRVTGRRHPVVYRDWAKRERWTKKSYIDVSFEMNRTDILWIKRTEEPHAWLSGPREALDMFGAVTGHCAVLLADRGQPSMVRRTRCHDQNPRCFNMSSVVAHSSCANSALSALRFGGVAVGSRTHVLHPGCIHLGR